MDRVRLAELCASASLFTDLGTGQPFDNGLRTCLVASRLADLLGLDDEERCEVYYVSLLRFLGCTADAHVMAEEADGNEIRLFARAAPVVMGSPLEEISQMIRLVGEGKPLPQRLRAIARSLSDPRGKERLLDVHCEVAGRLAEEIGLPAGVIAALEVAYARWDGRGFPRGLGGEDIPVAVRVAIVARDLEIWSRDTDVDTAEDVLGKRRGRAYDPAVVDAALDHGAGRLRTYEDDLWGLILAMEPDPWIEVTGPGIRRALTALGDFADLKAPQFSGHSRRVERLTATAASHLGLDPDVTETLTRAALVHDVGVVAIPTGIWQATRPLSSAEWEQARLHPMWSHRILARCEALAPVAVVAGRHHERIDGSGYPSGVTGAASDEWGVLAAAELYEEMTTPGRGRSGEDSSAAVAEMGRLIEVGALAHPHVAAVLEAAGAGVPSVTVERPAGLTEREIDVLRLLAGGSTNRQIADELRLSPKTIGSHVEHIYAKAGVRSRAAATLFALQNDLLV